MPPVRWKFAIAVFVMCVSHISSTVREPKELIDDGWKPIIGHGALREAHPSKEAIHYRPKNEKTTHRDVKFPVDNKHFRQPSKSEDISKREPMTEQRNKERTELKPTMTSTTGNGVYHNGQYHINKMPAQGKHHQIHYITSQGFSQPKPMLTQIIHNKIQKYPVISKTHISSATNGKRVAKPPRGPVGAYSQREEVLAPVPSTGLGNFAYFAQNNNNNNNSPNRINQHTNLDYINHFGNNELFQFQRLPVQQYVFPKQTTANDVHYTFQAQSDEYTRNLVPPPPSKEFIEKEKLKNKPTLKQKQPITEAPQMTKSQSNPPDILVQIPAPYQNQFYILNQNEQAIDVQVTKENVKELHNAIPVSFPNQDSFPNADNFQFVKKPSPPPSIPTYEVTEAKDWRDTPSYEQFQFQHAIKGDRRPQFQKPFNQPIIEQFLPTPVKPSIPIPTLPTQNEVSTIFTELSQKINKQKQQLDPTFFNVKEVSTHYPILGRPIANHFEFSFQNPDQQNEITTIKPRGSNKYQIDEDKEEVTEVPTTTTTTTNRTIPEPTKDWQQKRMPASRRRRPIKRTKPTTEEVIQQEQEIETTTGRERPLRKRPSHQRTTEGTINEKNVRIRYRQKPKPPQGTMEEEIIENQKTALDYAQKTLRGSYSTYKPSTKENLRRPQLNQFTTSNDAVYQNIKYPTRQENKHRIEDSIEMTDAEISEEMMEANEDVEYRTNKYEIPKVDETQTTTDISEEEEYSSTKDPESSEITIKEIYNTEEETTLATTTTTTPEPTTTKMKIRRRPGQYPIRPSFSLNPYKQKISDYIATTTESTKITTGNTRTRLSYGSRRPLTNRPVEVKEEQKEDTTEAQSRKKFVPKDPRHGTTQYEAKEDDINKTSRRPVARYRSTTTPATTTLKVSIRSGIYNIPRRPPLASLRDRIQSRNKTISTEKTTNAPETDTIDNEESEPTEVIFEQVISSTEAPKEYVQSTTRSSSTSTTRSTSTSTTEVTIEENEFGETDILKNDAFLQSQRVSDLTSSAQNDYNRPGVFKSVSPNVRRVPSYFTIATDDPILPIEAFFTNINKEKH